MVLNLLYNDIPGVQLKQSYNEVYCMTNQFQETLDILGP